MPISRWVRDRRREGLNTVRIEPVRPELVEGLSEAGGVLRQAQDKRFLGERTVLVQVLHSYIVLFDCKTPRFQTPRFQPVECSSKSAEGDELTRAEAQYLRPGTCFVPALRRRRLR